MSMIPITKFAIVGGPSGGKSSGLAYLPEMLRSLDFYPIVVPEAARLLISEGINPSGMAFQEAVMDKILALEDQAEVEAIHSGHPRPVLLCDRGLMDARGYVSDTDFFKLARMKGLNLSSMCDARYSAVFHMRTAAFDAEHAYKCDAERFESPEKARKVDERTLRGWVGHPQVHIIHNRVCSFEEKLELLGKRVRHALGVPEPLEIERKFLVDPVALHRTGVLRRKIVITQAYVKEADMKGELRIRSRTHYGHSTYFATRKKKIRDGVYREDERVIDFATYKEFGNSLVKGTGLVRKNRHCFVYRDQYFELDVFKGRHNGLYLLEIELPEVGAPVELPPFMHVLREVTGDRNYTNRTLSRLPK